MRKDIYERMNILNQIDIKPNFAGLAERYNCDYRTAMKYYNNPDSINQRKPKPSKLDKFKEIVQEKLAIPCTIMAIYKFIQKRGYEGKYTILRDYCKQIKQIEQNKATIRFETDPGVQAQVDWKETLKMTSKLGEVFIINIFLIILGYSRLKYIELTLDKNQDTLFSCIKNGLIYYNGVPKEILFDNMKTVVDQSRTQYHDAVINSKFYEFSKDMGFEVITCRSYRPKTKGKVENLAKLIDRLLVYNNEFESLEDLEEIVLEFNDDINHEICQSTNETPVNRFENEKKYLNPLPNQELLENFFTKPILRKVSNESLIAYKRSKYSVSTQYIGKTVEIKVEANTLCIYYNKLLIKKHEMTDKFLHYHKCDMVEILKSDAFKYKSDDEIDKFIENNMKIYDSL